MPLVNQDVPQCGMDGIMYAAVRRGQSRIGTDSRDEWWAWRTCAIRVDMSESGAESDGEPDGVGVSLPSRGMFEMMYEWLIGGDRR